MWLEEITCPVCEGTGYSKTKTNRWGDFKYCGCRNGKILTDDSREQLNIFQYWLTKELEDVFEPKH